MALTKKREEFCVEFVKLGNASAAYRKVYSCKNMKPATIKNNAYKLLQNNDVLTTVNNLQKEAAKIAKQHFDVDSKEILSHLNILRKSRIDEYVELVEKPAKTEDKKGNKITELIQVLQFKPFNQLTEEQLMCIESIKHGRNGIELRLHGKEWVFEKIGKHIGFYAEDNYQKTEIKTPEERRARIAYLYEKLNNLEVRPNQEQNSRLNENG